MPVKGQRATALHHSHSTAGRAAVSMVPTVPEEERHSPSFAQYRNQKGSVLNAHAQYCRKQFRRVDRRSKCLRSGGDGGPGSRGGGGLSCGRVPGQWQGNEGLHGSAAERRIYRHFPQLRHSPPGVWWTRIPLSYRPVNLFQPDQRDSTFNFFFLPMCLSVLWNLLSQQGYSFKKGKGIGRIFFVC